MPQYTFRHTRMKLKNPVRIFKIALADYDRVKARLEACGWERVLDLPSTVCVLKGYHELEEESYHEMKKNDRDGWAGSVTDA